MTQLRSHRDVIWQLHWLKMQVLLRKQKIRSTQSDGKSCLYKNKASFIDKSLASLMLAWVAFMLEKHLDTKLLQQPAAHPQVSEGMLPHSQNIGWLIATVRFQRISQQLLMANLLPLLILKDQWKIPVMSYLRDYRLFKINFHKNKVLMSRFL